MTNYKAVRFMSPLTLLGLAACSGGGSSVTQAGGGGGQAAVFNIGGNANKGPLQGAIAFIDANGNNIPDAGEVQATTLADGSYILEAPTATARVVVVSTDATIDTSSGAAVTDLVMAAPAGATMVTPLTTLIDASPTLSVAELQSALGITADPLTFNPFADGADAAQAVAAEKAAQQIASTVLTATKVTGGDASALSASVKALASALETAANRGGADTTFDFADADEITSVLNAAATTASVDISASVATLAGSIANVNQVMEDTLVEGVNLTSSDIKNALATVNQFTAAIAELDAADITAGISSAAVGGFDDLETVKAAVKNAAPTDIKLNGLLISSDDTDNDIGIASAVDGDATANGSKIFYTLLGDDAEFFSLDVNSGALTVNREVEGFADKSSFSIAIKATDYIDDGTAGVTVIDGEVGGFSSKGKSYVEAFTIVKQNEKALVVSESLTLKDYDVANNSAESPGADEIALTGTVSDGTLTIASDPVKLNLQNLKALAEGEGGQSPIVALTLSKVPVTSEKQTALIRLTLTDGVDGSADEGERVVSLDVKLNYEGDGTTLTLSLPDQEVAGYYIGSDGTKVPFEGLENSATDVLTLTDGKLTAPTSLDVKIASLISLAKENASVDLLQAGKYHLSLSLIDDDAYDGLALQAATGENITSINMGINIVDEGEIFQLAGNSVTVSSDGEEDQVLEAEASGGVLSLTQNVEFEESEIKAMSAGLGELPSFSFELSKVANTTDDVKVRLSLMDGSDTTVMTGERAISFDVDLKWDADASTFTLGDGTISGEVTLSDGTVLEDVTIENGAADVLAISPSSNSLSGSSLSVKLGGLVAATSEFASIDLLAIGNYTLQVETLDGVQLFDATGEEISKVQATVAVVADAPLDLEYSQDQGDAGIVTNGKIYAPENYVSGSPLALLNAKYDGNDADNLTFSIVDSDSDATNNAFKIVELDEGNNLGVPAGSYLAVDNADLIDFETANSSKTMQVKVKAENGSRSGTETFTVTVTDVNEAPVAPTVTSEISVGTGVADGVSIDFDFVGTDVDASDVGKLTYDLVSATKNGVAANLAEVPIDVTTSANGEAVFTTNGAIVEDDVGVYVLTIIVQDVEGLNATAEVTANIVANAPPEITNTSFIGTTIKEDTAAGTEVFTIAGRDLIKGTDDEYSTSGLTFQISGNDNFVVDEDTGVVTVSSGASFDFEADGGTTETFNIFVTDSDNTPSTTQDVVTVTIEDANEAPAFSATEYAVTTDIKETALVGAAVATITAEDIDAGDTLTYSLSGSDKDKFSIDSSTGVITVNGSLSGMTSYTFDVKAEDGDKLYDTITVTGGVEDRADNPFSVTTGTTITNTYGTFPIAGDSTLGTPEAGDVMVTVTANFGSIDTDFVKTPFTAKYSDYEAYDALEIVNMNVEANVTGVTDPSEILVAQSWKGETTLFKSFNALDGSAPANEYDVGVVGTGMVSETSSSVDLFYFILDKSALSAATSETSIDITFSGNYRLIEETDAADNFLDVDLDPFVVTVDIA